MLRGRLVITLLVLSFALVACEEQKGLRITGIEPKEGPWDLANQVTIQGSGFSKEGAMGVTVYFGDRKGSNPFFRGDNKLVVTAPSGEAGETVDVVIQFDDGRRYPYKQAYTYIEQRNIKVDDLLKDKKTK